MFQVSWKKLFWWKLVTKNAGSTPDLDKTAALTLTDNAHIVSRIFKLQKLFIPITYSNIPKGYNGGGR